MFPTIKRHFVKIQHDLLSENNRIYLKNMIKEISCDKYNFKRYSEIDNDYDLTITINNCELFAKIVFEDETTTMINPGIIIIKYINKTIEEITDTIQTFNMIDTNLIFNPVKILTLTDLHEYNSKCQIIEKTIENKLYDWQKNVLDRLTQTKDKIIKICSPPGSGKTFLINHIIENNLKHEFLIIIPSDCTSIYDISQNNCQIVSNLKINNKTNKEKNNKILSNKYKYVFIEEIQEPKMKEVLKQKFNCEKIICFGYNILSDGFDVYIDKNILLEKNQLIKPTISIITTDLLNIEILKKINDTEKFTNIIIANENDDICRRNSHDINLIYNNNNLSKEIVGSNLKHHRKIKDDFVKGKIKILCVNYRFLEGFNVPNANTIVLCDFKPSWNIIKHTQYIGRCTRKFDNKYNAYALYICEINETNKNKEKEMRKHFIQMNCENEVKTINWKDIQ